MYKYVKSAGKVRSQIALSLSHLVILFAGLFWLAPATYGQATFGMAPAPAPAGKSGPFRIGEKLTYTASFGRFINAAFIETVVVSDGQLSGRPAVELHSKLKTLELVSAAFFQIDERRIVFASPDTGLPIYILRSDYSGPLPKETVGNFIAQPAANFDLLTLLYRVRAAGGSGTFTFFENDRLFTATFQPEEKRQDLRTEAGHFSTIVSTVQTEFMANYGIKDMRINLTDDEYHVPVMIRFRTQRGEFRASLSAIDLPDRPVSVPVPTLNPTPIPTPVARATPLPEVYVDNKPLAPELGFELAESLNYRVTNAGRPAGTVTLTARERKLFQRQDSLLLTAEVTKAEAGTNFLVSGNAARVQANPETLVPRWMESRFASPFAGLNQSLTFDHNAGTVSVAGGPTIEAPVGTHTLLTLLYAMRSFNLRPSKDLSNPVNDTRVAVFWDGKVQIFTLRPGNPELLTINGEKVSAQPISVNTGDKDLDAMNIRVWLGTESRVPLRITWGQNQADLITTETRSR